MQNNASGTPEKKILLVVKVHAQQTTVCEIEKNPSLAKRKEKAVHFY